jgi:hypothetical protein
MIAIKNNVKKRWIRSEEREVGCQGPSQQKKGGK